MDYKSSGVDIEAGNALVNRIKPLAAQTSRPEVLGNIGGFGALFQLDTQKYRQPVLVSGTDGVGTKLKLAMGLGRHDTIGIDLVAMCVNDLITLGAEPLFFLDYYATGALTVDIASDVISGIAKGCELAGAALIGGETAEMPGMYSGQDYDLAGFCVGVVEKDQIIDGSHCQAGDQLIALASSGPHSNGYSLIRRVLEQNQIKLRDTFPESDQNVGEILLEPTRIYVKAIRSLLETTPVKAISHITGGGLLENIPRVIPDHLCAQLDQQSWEWPDIFRWLQIKGNIATNEMARTFNCGVGMVICVAKEHASSAIERLQANGEHAWILGQLDERSDNQNAVEFC